MYCLQQEIRMSEAKALVIFAVGYLVAVCVATLVAIRLGAGGTVLGLLLVIVCAAGGFFSSLIVSHYTDLKKRRKREEILLSR